MKQNIFFLLFIFTVGFADAQIRKPVLKDQPKEISVKPKPISPKERVVLLPATATASTSIATADQLYFKNAAFLLRTVRDYRYLTVKNDLSRSSIVWRYASWDQDNQRWTLVQKPGGYFKLKSTNGLFLKIGGRANYYIVSEPESNNDDQLWQLENADNGNYFIKSKAGQYVSVMGSELKDGMVVSATAAKDGGDFQKWQLIKMDHDGRRTSTFAPERNGFHFGNTFNGEDFIRWSGLCGGMVYTALDYFRNHTPIPTQSYPPANGTALQSYIFQRQQHSMANVNEKWSELQVSYGTRGGEIFRWGIQGYGGGRLEELRNNINANKAVPIGLFTGGIHGIDGNAGGDHVMLATGYALGRYKGDFTGHPEDYKIFAYDPNMGNTMVTIVPNLAAQCYFEVESGIAWRAYFVNERYDNDHTAPAGIPNFPEGEPEGSIRHLYAQFKTGGDDLRGNNDNVNIRVHYRDGSFQDFNNVNNSARWVDKSSQTVHLGLNRAVRKTDILHFTIQTTFGDAIDSDDWNLEGISISNGAGGIVFGEKFAERAGAYIMRFSGDQHLQRYSLPVR